MITKNSRDLPDQVDVVVIGSGAAGTTAAVRAADEGLNVAVIEKSGYLGGTTSAGGGVIWAPNNTLIEQKGWDDSAEKSADYLRAATDGGMTDEEIDWYVRTSRAAVEWLRTHSHVTLNPLRRPDYHGAGPEHPSTDVGWTTRPSTHHRGRD